jgi:TPR repeat protein
MMAIKKPLAITLLLLAASLGACTSEVAPDNARIESVGMLALHGRQPGAVAQLQAWAAAGRPVAQRELALALASMPDQSAQAGAWLQKAAAAGDPEARFQLAQAFYQGNLGLKLDQAQAWSWYERAAASGNAKAGFMLARMAKYGEGVPRNLQLSATWLLEASKQGNAQAMFLLSNAYAAGEGVEQNPQLARVWLERSAEGDFPVAIQALAMSLESGDQHGERDPVRARHLIKEATDERSMRWNNYQ